MYVDKIFYYFSALASCSFFFLSSMGHHTLTSHASTEACLRGWPNAQPQGWYLV